MNKPPIFIRPTNIPSLPLGIDLIPWDFRVLSNMGGAEKKILQPHFHFIKNSPASKTRDTATLVTSAEKEINKLKKKFDVWLLPFQSSEGLWKLCKKNGWKPAFNHPKLAHKLESKNNLKKFFAGEDFLIPSKNYSKKEAIFSKLKKKWGETFIAQHISKSGLPPSGGKSTFLIKSEADFEKFLTLVKANDVIRISKFLTGNSLSMNGCIVADKLFAGNPFLQLIGIPEADLHVAGYCGFDLDMRKKLSQKANSAAKNIMQKVAQKLIEYGYQGYFGIDLLLEEKTKKVYLLEINPRMVGSIGLMNYAQKKARSPSLLEHHIRAFLGENISKLEHSQQQKILNNRLSGSRTLIRQQENESKIVTKSPQSGIYEITKDGLRFSRPAWNPTQLKKSNEVLVYGLAPRMSHTKTGSRIANIFSWQSVAKSSYQLKPKFAKAARWLYRQFEFRGTEKSRKKLPVLITIPHGSLKIPAAIRKQVIMSDDEIKHEKCDLYTEDIFDVSNAKIIKAPYSRIAADLNRNAQDYTLDAEGFCRDGVIVSKQTSGTVVFEHAPTKKEARERIKKYHRPFHDKVSNSIPKVQFLIDGHSAWSRDPKTGAKRADIMISNRNFETCDKQLTQKIATFFQKKGFRASINKPFLGKYVIEKHCKKNRTPGIQLEINRSLYLNEKTLKPKKREIARLNTIITELVECIAQEVA